MHDVAGRAFLSPDNCRCKPIRPILVNMIDIRTIRDNPDVIKASQRARGASETDVDTAIEADEVRRSTLQTFEDKRAEQKED